MVMDVDVDVDGIVVVRDGNVVIGTVIERETASVGRVIEVTKRIAMIE